MKTAKIGPSSVETTVKENPNAKVIAFVHAETSTGVLSNASALCAIAKDNNLLSIVDAVTSLGGVPVDLPAVRRHHFAFTLTNQLVFSAETGQLSYLAGASF